MRHNEFVVMPVK